MLKIRHLKYISRDGLLISYPCIPHETKKSVFPLTTKLKWMNLCLGTNYFEFNVKIIHQILRTAIVTKSSTSCAWIFKDEIILL